MSLLTRWAGSQIPSFSGRNTFSPKPVPQTPTEHWSTGSPNHWNGHRELLHFSKRLARCISASASDSSGAAALAVCGEVKPSKPCVVQALETQSFSAKQHYAGSLYCVSYLGALLLHPSSRKHRKDDASHPRSSSSSASS